MKLAQWFLAAAVTCAIGSCRCGGSQPYAGAGPVPNPGPGDFGAACLSGLDCSTGFCCREGLCPGGFCTIACGWDGDCPTGTVCADVGAYFACMIYCGAGFPCRPGYVCRDRNSVPICREP